MDFWLWLLIMGITRSRPQTRQYRAFWYFSPRWWEEFLRAFHNDEPYWHIYRQRRRQQTINSSSLAALLEYSREDENGADDLRCKQILYLIRPAPVLSPSCFSVALCLYCAVFLEVNTECKKEKCIICFLHSYYLNMFFFQVKLSRLCEQDKILQELEARIRTLKEDKVFVKIHI